MTELAEAFAFLAQLEQNNDREWYQANRSQYQAACGAFEALVGALILQVRSFDETIPLLQPKDLTFKLVRDTRFSRDKSPYRPALRAHIGPKGKLPIPVGYYLYLQPGGRSFLGGGLFADMFRDATARIRDRIAARPEAWEAVTAALSASQLPAPGGTKLKAVPRGYEPAHPQAESLKHKSWYLELPVPDSQVLAEDFVPFAADAFARMRPLNDFLNQALEGFQMPARPS